jgi:hypothetical protein
VPDHLREFSHHGLTSKVLVSLDDSYAVIVFSYYGVHGTDGLAKAEIEWAAGASPNFGRLVRPTVAPAADGCHDVPISFGDTDIEFYVQNFVAFARDEVGTLQCATNGIGNDVG